MSVNTIIPPNLPTNFSSIQNNSNGVLKDLIQPSNPKPIISIPYLDVSNRIKDFTNGMDESFKTRSSQLSNSNFKDMPSLIRVTTRNLDYVYNPQVSNINSTQIIYPVTSNRVSLSDTNNIIGEKSDRKINSLQVISVVGPKNNYNDVVMPNNKKDIVYDQIPEIQQDVEMYRVKY